jgi:hypothetical protein
VTTHTIEQARDEIRRARLFDRKPATWAVGLLMAHGEHVDPTAHKQSEITAPSSPFKEVGFNDDEARRGVRMLESGRYFGFEDVCTNLLTFAPSERRLVLARRVFPHRVAEVAKRLPEHKVLLERRTPSSSSPLLVERASTRVKGEGLYEARLISVGQGSSGYYPAATLEEAARGGVFASGTQCYLDHPTESDQFERPERSVRDLAGTLASPGVFREGAVFADVRVFAQHRDLIAEMAPYIGMSIRADGVRENRADGGFIRPTVTRIDRVVSVDFVTQAGRGGRLMV